MAEYDVIIAGAGLAGSEAAYQLAESGYKVNLIEMRPLKTTPAHETDKFAELVCSNSLKSLDITTGSGLLKKEMMLYNSFLMQTALKCSVPAGGALAVDRVLFSNIITNSLKNHKNILIKVFLTTIIQFLFYHSIPYLIYLSFGLNEYGLITFIFMEAVLYISVSSLPFPGAIGISEGGFLTMFKMFFPTSILSSAMLISRGVSFYLFVIITGIIILSFIVYDKYKSRKANLI